MNYGEFLRKIQGYCIDKKIKNEILVNEPLEDFFDAAKLKKEKGKNAGDPFRYEYSESSKIKNNNLEISPQIREALCKVGMEDIIVKSVQRFYDDYIDKGSVGDMIDDFLTWIEESGKLGNREISKIKSVSNDPGLFLGKIVVRALKESNLQQNEKESAIWNKGNGYINVIKGNLLTYAIGRRSRKERIVVIPVNTSFDTHITTKSEKEPNPLVSKNTIHGELLYRLSIKGVSEDELDLRIRDDLMANGLLKGNKKKIKTPIGTIASLDEGGATLYLLAISDFDEKNNAQSTKRNIQIAIEKMIDYYDRKGQGNDLYMPLMGTGLSRAGLSHQESLDLIIKTLCNNTKKISGGINIVVQPIILKGLTIRKEK